ncbi:MAG: phosphoribosylformylglycinamidine cyclo-ligase [Gammaproteobacteria bacterium]|nr:MAG: phosphoribosylformylglycinamidine cyclo-ligase [Gammaproteobacteria bacterium]
MSRNSTRPTLTYADAGVDIAAGNALVERIRPLVRATRTAGVLGGIGGFGGLFELPSGYREPVLVSGTDGVGTKLKLAIELGRHDTIGIDLVAMCVNDILVCGAEPLWFLDYFATGKLDLDHAETVIRGIADGCRQASCALLGGETAEMPGMYARGDYDLAGFAVGIIEKSAILDGSAVAEGDLLLGLASSGPHSNGYSLIRRVLAESAGSLETMLPGTGNISAGDALLAPTRIYVPAIRSLLQTIPVRALAHITGGGLTENLPRVLPEGLDAVIDTGTWHWPAVFNWLQEAGNISETEMYRTFNCGIGMVAVVAPADADAAIAALDAAGEDVAVIGRVVRSAQAQPAVHFNGQG